MAERMSRIYNEWLNDGADQRRASCESQESIPQYVQVIPPPRAHVADRDLKEHHGRIGEWCAKTAALAGDRGKGKDKEFARVRSWEVGDPEKTRPDPFTA